MTSNYSSQRTASAADNAAICNKHLFSSSAAGQPGYAQWPDHRDSVELHRHRNTSSSATTNTTSESASCLLSCGPSKKEPARVDSGFSMLHVVPTEEFEMVKCPRLHNDKKPTVATPELRLVPTEDLKMCKAPRHQHSTVKRFARKLRHACAATGHACKVAGHHIRESLSDPYGDADMDTVKINTHSNMDPAGHFDDDVYNRLQKMRYREASRDQMFGQDF